MRSPRAPTEQGLRKTKTSGEHPSGRPFAFLGWGRHPADGASDRVFSPRGRAAWVRALAASPGWQGSKLRR
eukprot:6118261-Pyramimonas_sp.AAC.1